MKDRDLSVWLQQPVLGQVSQGLHLVSHMSLSGPTAIFLCLSQDFSEELDCKLSSWDTNLCPFWAVGIAGHGHNYCASMLDPYAKI